MLYFLIIIFFCSCTNYQKGSTPKFIPLNNSGFLIESVHRKNSIYISSHRSTSTGKDCIDFEEATKAVREAYQFWLHGLERMAKAKNFLKSDENGNPLQLVKEVDILSSPPFFEPDLTVVFTCGNSMEKMVSSGHNKNRSFYRHDKPAITEFQGYTFNRTIVMGEELFHLEGQVFGSRSIYRTSTIFHEFGHAFGLADTYTDDLTDENLYLRLKNQPESMMSVPFTLVDGKIMLRNDDLDGLEWLYRVYVLNEINKDQCLSGYFYDPVNRGCVPPEASDCHHRGGHFTDSGGCYCPSKKEYLFANQQCETKWNCDRSAQLLNEEINQVWTCGGNEGDHVAGNETLGFRVEKATGLFRCNQNEIVYQKCEGFCGKNAEGVGFCLPTECRSPYPYCKGKNLVSCEGGGEKVIKTCKIDCQEFNKGAHCLAENAINACKIKRGFTENAICSDTGFLRSCEDGNSEKLINCVHGCWLDQMNLRVDCRNEPIEDYDTSYSCDRTPSTTWQCDLKKSALFRCNQGKKEVISCSSGCIVTNYLNSVCVSRDILLDWHCPSVGNNPSLTAWQCAEDGSLYNCAYLGGLGKIACENGCENTKHITVGAQKFEGICRGWKSGK